MPKQVTKQQLKANRQNAGKSTGPRTTEGKRQTARNALKHGLLAKEVVILDGDGAETQADFDALLADLCQELRPMGIIEETLVERIATCYWRLRRAQRYEVGAIRNTLDECNREHDDPDIETADDVRRQLDQAADDVAGQQLILDTLESAPDLTDSAVFEWLVPALNRIADQRSLPQFQPPPPPTREQMVRSILAPSQPDPFERQDQAGQAFLTRLAQAGLSPPRLHRALVKAQRALLAEYKAHAADLERDLELANRYDRLRADRRALAGSLPAHDSLIKLVRYETMLDRQLHRALAQLQQRQATRHHPDPDDGPSGADPPPPPPPPRPPGPTTK